MIGILGKLGNIHKDFTDVVPLIMKIISNYITQCELIQSCCRLLSKLSTHELYCKQLLFNDAEHILVSVAEQHWKHPQISMDVFFILCSLIANYISECQPLFKNAKLRQLALTSVIHYMSPESKSAYKK